MRKGRSHRRPRGSLPPTSQKSLQPLGGGVHVVVGLNGPPSSTQDVPVPEVSDHEEHGPETPVVQADGRPTLEVIPDKSLELVRERSLEVVRQESLELVRQETLELAREAVVEESPFVAESREREQPAPEPIRTAAYAPYEQEAFDDDLASYSASAPETPMVHVTALTTPDEISIPPASDVGVELADESFFEEGDRASSMNVTGGLAGHGDDPDDWGDDLGTQKAKLKASPEAIARRAKFTRVVMYAVAVATVVCVAGFVRSAGRSNAPTVSAKTTNAVTAVEPPAEKAAQPAAIAPAPVAPAHAVANDEPKAPEAKVAEPKVESPKADEPKAEAAKADEPKAAPVSDKTALEEKKISQRALERGKLVDAIEAGERSVALDPTDGEAWLILGASYQSKGNGKDARRCYSACVKEGKRGPLSECRAMLR